MRGWLFDTNVVSEPRRPKPNPKVRAFFVAQKLSLQFISEITIAEIRFGIEHTDDLEKRTELANWLELTIRPIFEGRVLRFDEDAMLKWRNLMAEGRKIRHTFSEPDLIIAATAAASNLIVVTRDTKQFVATGVAVFDPWKSVLYANGQIMNVRLTDYSDAFNVVCKLVTT